jgi:ubiquinone/menaquinone biosynthesis C-methylase UbiE
MTNSNQNLGATSGQSASFISKVFIATTKLAKPCMKHAWQFLYNQLASKDSKNLLLFMNYGYSDDKLDSIELQSPDEPFRYPIQLYAKVVQNLNLDDKLIAEVGCGRGGGGSYLARYHNISEYTGIDLSSEAIKKCKELHTLSNLKWLEGNAESLPLDSNTIDILINVESSHCYPSMINFLQEVHRVLKPSGKFAFCDLRSTDELDVLEKQITTSKFKIIDKQIITPQIIKALDLLSEDREKNIIARIPKFLQPALRDFMAIKNSAMYNGFVNGDMSYVYYLCDVSI